MVAVTIGCGAVRDDPTVVQTVTLLERLATLAVTGLQPQRFVADAPAWPTVQRAAFDAGGMVQLGADRGSLAPLPALEKLWAEAIYEDVRERVLPDAPSRLDCLYAVQMGDDAFDILPELGLTTATFDASGWATSGPMIIPARTRGRWVAVDMRLFDLPAGLSPSEDVITTQRVQLEALAERYWHGERSNRPLVELLCDGLDVDGWAGYTAAPPPPGPG